MKEFWKLVILLLVLSVYSSLHAQMKVAGVFSDNMVLQQDAKVAIWGEARAGSPIAIKASWGETVETTTDDQGKWRAYVTSPASSPRTYEIEISDDNGSTVFKNVVTGEVWFCAGQSNMQFQLSRSKGVERDRALINNPQIRLFRESKKGWEESTYDVAKDFSAVGFYFGLSIHRELDVPVGLIQSAVGGSPIESWIPLKTLQEDPALKVTIDRWQQWKADYDASDAAAYEAALEDWKAEGKTAEEPLMPRSVYSIKRYHHRRGILYKDKVRPFIPYGIKGVLWYQGESNMEWPDEYEYLFQNLVTSWRTAWGQGDFPFYYVQIPPYDYTVKYGVDRRLSAPILREAQNRIQKLRNTGMVGTMDVGDPTNIHPINKKPIGQRLALVALAKTYGQEEIEFSGPTLKRCVISGSEVLVEFDHASGGLVVKDDSPKWFELAGRDGIFHPALARVKLDEVIVSTEKVPDPVKIRYAWQAGCVTNLFNSEELPAIPFLVDPIRGGD